METLTKTILIKWKKKKKVITKGQIERACRGEAVEKLEMWNMLLRNGYQ